MELVFRKGFDEGARGGLSKTSAERNDGDEDDESKRGLAFRAGFVSLQERLSNLTSKRRQRSDVDQSPADDWQQPVEGFRQAPQFATLQEFFQSKSSLRKQCELDRERARQRRPKIPVMKLSKEDWNVKCWEERVRSQWGHKRSASGSGHEEEADRARGQTKKLDRRIEVFYGRIDEVAMKLDKVREGLPLDEQLDRLERNKILEAKSSHTWTDLLKEELARGTHNSKLLRSQASRSEAEWAATGSPVAPVVKSVLGRPIRRINRDSDEEE